MYGISFHFGPLLEECVQRDRGERLVLVSPQSKMNLSHHLSSTTINQVSPIFPIKKSCPSFFPMFLLIKTWFPFIFSTINQLFPYHFPTFFLRFFPNRLNPAVPPMTSYDFVRYAGYTSLTGLEEMDLGSSNTISSSTVVEDAVPWPEAMGKKPWEAGNSYGFGWENGWENGWDIIDIINIMGCKSLM